MMLEIFTLALFGVGGWFWLDSMRAREAALDAGRRACQAENVQFLDDTVALSRIRLVRAESGRVSVARVYDFEFSDTGNNRRAGSMSLLGATLVALRLPIPERTIGLQVAGEESPPRPDFQRLH